MVLSLQGRLRRLGLEQNNEFVNGPLGNEKNRTIKDHLSVHRAWLGTGPARSFLCHLKTTCIVTTCLLARVRRCFSFLLSFLYFLRTGGVFAPFTTQLPGSAVFDILPIVTCTTSHYMFNCLTKQRKGVLVRAAEHNRRNRRVAVRREEIKCWTLTAAHRFYGVCLR